MCEILVVLVIVMASIIASSAAVTSVIIITTAMSTSALIITMIIIIVIASVGGIKLPAVALVLAPNCFAVTFHFVGNLYNVSCHHLVDHCRVCSLCYYLYNSHYDNNYLSLHNFLLLLGEKEMVEAVVEVSVCLYLISFLIYFWYF